jgi:solute carrier family 25 iron transporter 28/37
VLSDAVLVPMDAVKQKRQLSLKAYRGTFDCLRTVVRVEGVRALYAGYITTLTMNVPYNFIYFATYESFRKILKTKREFDPVAHILAGGG